MSSKSTVYKNRLSSYFDNEGFYFLFPCAKYIYLKYLYISIEGSDCCCGYIYLDIKYIMLSITFSDIEWC